MASESEIQLLTEGSGPLVRTVTVTTVIDGVPTDVQMQVVAISDAKGRLITADWLAVSEQLALVAEKLDELKGVLIAGLRPNSSDLRPL